MGTQYSSRYCSRVIGATPNSANAALVAPTTASVSWKSVPFQSQTMCGVMVDMVRR